MSKIAFGEFCKNDSCTQYAWGMSVTFTIFGFDVGLYVDEDGLSLILGTDDHVLIDQATPAARPGRQKAITTAVDEAPMMFGFPSPPNSKANVKPGAWQPYLKPVIKSPVDTWPKSAPVDAGCKGLATSTHSCPFVVNPGVGRALFVAGWQKGSLGVQLIKPDNTVITAANAAANGVTITVSKTAELKQVSFAVNPTAGMTIPSGSWTVKLTGVGGRLVPPAKNNYRIMFAADPAKPTLEWKSILSPGATPDAQGMLDLQWEALRNNNWVGDDVKIELVYTPLDTKPITPPTSSAS